MRLSEGAGIEGKTFVVTGGLGFVGSALCFELLRRGAQRVRSFDLRSISPYSDDLQNRGVQCIQGDFTRKEDVEGALRGADCIFHLASYGGSGKEMLQLDRIDEVNIDGTCHVLEACLELGVRRLVYVSTYNVVFGGKEIFNGDESLPYFPTDENVDPYGRSKTIAEQLVLKYNGGLLKENDEKCLHTCAVRPAAIYGPGEDRYLPRPVSLAKLGLLPFNIGEASVKTDWVFVDNLVEALILASMGLLYDIPGKEGNPVAAGQPYFISDGYPVNSFEFIRPLLRILDQDLPKWWIGNPVAHFLAKILRGIYSIFLYPWLNSRWLPEPLFLPAEVYKVGITHYFSHLKAQKELGYVPKVSPEEGMAATISYWQDRERRALDGPKMHVWLFVMSFHCLMLYWSIVRPPSPPAVFRVRLMSLAIVVIHICESTYAWTLAKRVDPSNARGWFWQTFVLGIFSLRFLWKRAKK